jgi:hypothetical protein
MPTSRLTQASIFALSEATNLFKDSGVCSLGSTKKYKQVKEGKARGKIIYRVCIKVVKDNLSSHKHFTIFRKNQKWNCL